MEPRKARNTVEFPVVKPEERLTNPDARIDHKRLQNIRNYNLTNETRTVKAIVAPPGKAGAGDFTDIQTAINFVSADGGGVVFLRNGTYKPTADITVPGVVTVQGETSDGAIIDFLNAAYQIRVSGTLVYSTGTVAVNNASTAVTGTGTTFTSSMIGESILLRGRWFTVATVPSATSLTISVKFDADAITSYGTIIATPVIGTVLKGFTVQNSTHADGAVYSRYALAIDIDGVSVYTSTIGINSLAVNVQSFLDFYTDGCGTGVKVTNCAVFTVYNFETYASTGVNLLCDRFYTVSVANATISSAGGDNVNMTSCEGWSFYDMENTTAGGQGIEMITCKDIEVFAMAVRRAVSDGIKLTSDCSRISIHNVSLLNNGGYGVNIAAASDDRNTITSSFFSGNTSGTVNNAGTNTINANNQV